MNRVIAFVALTLASLALTIGPAQAADAKVATPAQAKEMFAKVVAHTKQVGCDKAFAEFNKPTSTWNSTYSNVYMSAGDWSGVTVVQGKVPTMVGQNHIDVKDAEGKAFIKSAIEDCKKSGKSEQPFKWKNTATNKVEGRTLMAEVVDCNGKKVDVGITYIH